MEKIVINIFTKSQPTNFELPKTKIKKKEQVVPYTHYRSCLSCLSVEKRAPYSVT